MNKKLLSELLLDKELVKNLFYDSINFVHNNSCTNSETFRQYLFNKYKPNEETNFKDKIKVYIKEPNIPEYIQLWDKFDKENVEDWLEGKKYIGIYKIYYDVPQNNIGKIRLIFTNKTIVSFTGKVYYPN